MRLRWVVGTVGALVTGVAVLAALGSGLGPVAETVDPLVTALAGLGSEGLVLASVTVAVLGLVVSLLVPGGERVLADDGATERFERLLDRPPEGVTRTAPRTGGALDGDVDRAVAGNERALSAVRERLRDLAVTAVADRTDDPAPAIERVASGAWTDDRTAAAFLADGDPTASLRSRLRLWFDPESERERRLRRTAAAIDRLVDDGARGTGASGPGTVEDAAPGPTGDAARGPAGDAVPEPTDDPGVEPAADPDAGTDRASDGGTASVARGARCGRGRVTDARTGRWQVAAPATLALVSLGLLYASPLLLAGALVPLGYAVYAALSAVPGDASVRVERSFADRAPAPGARVTVAVTVTNTGEAVLPDVRVVDGVAPELAVVAGSPRRSLALRPGESATYRYEVVARRGEFAFADAGVRLRSLAGSGVRTASPTVDGDERLAVRYPLSDAETGGATPRLSGTHPTDSAGAGAEFHSTREYRSGDPRSRLDWRRLAKTGELATVSFREERAVRTVLVVDAREPGRVAPRAGVPTGADLSGYAGERLFESLTNAGTVTSLVALGVDGTDTDAPVRPGGFVWADGTADARRALVRSVFDAVGDVADPHAGTSESAGPSSTASDDGGVGGVGGDGVADGTGPSVDGDAGSDERDERVRLFLTQLPPAAAVVLVSPLLDDWPVSLVRALRSRGHRVTVVSPDVTGTGTVGGTVAGVERRRRLATLAAVGARTNTWAPGDSLALALAGVSDSVRGDA